MPTTDLFFGIPVDPLSLGGKTLALLLAVLFGGLIGLEREWHGNPAGMRTHILVCVGATLITLTSVEVGLGVRGGMRGDPGHIAAQIVSGIGFLGAGAILRDGATVRGLTTAASVWATAGIGMALGASPRLGETALVATGIVLCTLSVLSRLEIFLRVRRGLLVLDLAVREAEQGPVRVLDALCQKGIEIDSVASESEPAGEARDIPHGGTIRKMHLRVRLPQGLEESAVRSVLTEQPAVVSFTVSR